MKALRTNAPKTLIYNVSRFFTTVKALPSSDEPSAAYYDDLLNTAGRIGDFSAVHHLLNKRYRKGCFNTTNTFKFISADLSRLDELIRTLARLDEGFARKSAYDSLIARLSKLHLTDEALRVADTMVRCGYGANASTFHPVLNALTRRRKMDRAWRVVDLMRESRVPIDVTAYNYILTSYCFVGDLKSAAGVLTTMVEQGLEADERTYDALVLGACKAGKMEGAMAVLRRMEDHGVSPLYSTYVHVIVGLLGLGGYEQAMEFVLIYGGRDKKLDIENFGILCRRLINLKRFDDAKMVLDEMKNRGLPIDHKLRDFYLLHI